jgi:ferric-dicitrate binding protein FerR (iron transport regulator)
MYELGRTKWQAELDAMHRQAQRQVEQEEAAAKAERRKDRRQTSRDLLSFLAVLVVVSAFWLLVGWVLGPDVLNIIGDGPGPGPCHITGC